MFVFIQYSYIVYSFNKRKSSSKHQSRLSTRNREILCNGFQSLESNWTQKANVIYWCSVGQRSPKPGEHTGPKNHKWDIDRFEGGEEKKKLYLTMKCLIYPIEWLTFSLFLCLCVSPTATFAHTTFNSAVTFNSVCSYDNPSNRPLGAGLTAPQGVEMKRLWSQLYKIL